MGTATFSEAVLKNLIQHDYNIVQVVSQPDRRVGRKKELKMPEVKVVALEHDIPVFQPQRIKDDYQAIIDMQPDLIITAAYGQMIPQEILDCPRLGCINVHASLLPKYRGAAPIQWAVINGEKVSGVTTMRMDEGIDTGDMILKEEVELDPEETGGSLFERLAKTGAELCVKTLVAIENGTATYTPQDNAKATHTKMIKKQLGEIDFTKPAEEIERLVRGLNPWPSAYTHWNGKTLKVWKASVLDKESGKEPGTIEVGKNTIAVQTGKGMLQLEEIQLEGKKRMQTDAFLRGVSLETGMILGK